MNKTKKPQETLTTTSSSVTGATYFDPTSGGLYITTGGTTSQTAGWTTTTEDTIGGQKSFDFGPKFTKPDDPIEEAELKLAGICPECKNKEGGHEWGCSEYDWLDPNGYTISGSSRTWASTTTGATLYFDNTSASLPTYGQSTDSWTCDAFGMDGQVKLKVEDGKQPNWFHRTMQKILIGNEWKKDN